MATPFEILKRRHTVPPECLIQLLKQIRSLNGEDVSPFNRFTKDASLDQAKEAYMDKKFLEIVREPIASILEMSGVDAGVDGKKLACHVAIQLANKSDARGDVLLPETSTSSAPDASNQPGKRKATEEASEVAEEVKKRLKEEKEVRNKEAVETLLTKVKHVCTQAKPNNAMIIATLDDLKERSDKTGHADAPLFSDLLWQVERNAERLDVPELVLAALSSASDKVFNAVQKCLKSKRTARQDKSDSQPKVEQQVQPFQPFYSPPGFYQGFGGFSNPGYGGYGGFQGQFRGR
ncbi:unnamed protein product [Owenia fusiformis]|uniref:Uncharacterized protein n=1 Tax=Owenia fusiformis TaxID=6347 RepID=A0A8S4QBV8_OWEFU|nr:unnamed protein product [Owenia fusiformis]